MQLDTYLRGCQEPASSDMLSGLVSRFAICTIRRTRWYGKQRSAACASLTEHKPLTLFKAAGTAIPSFTSTLISDNLAAGTSPVHDEEDIKGVAGTLYGGAFFPSYFEFRRSRFTRSTF